MFQSAPLTEARGDVEIVPTVTFEELFQSAPLTEARGDGPITATGRKNDIVSIRSPHRSEGRPWAGSVAEPKI